MAVETIQCPKCGSPLEITDGTRLAECTFCGSTLRITQGASGHPLGVLEGIKEDTSLMAKERALEVVRQRIARLEEERATLESERATWLAAARMPGPQRQKAERALWDSLPAEERAKYRLPLAGRIALGIAAFAAAISLLRPFAYLSDHAAGIAVLSLLVGGAFFLHGDSRRTSHIHAMYEEHLTDADPHAPQIRSLTMEIRRIRAREERLREEIDRQAMQL